MHGGGFSGGDKSAGHDLAKHLVQKNIACASIDYTLYMKGKNFSCGGILTEKVKAIQIAVNQLWKATHFLMQKSNDIHIDNAKIIIAGSSAGGEAVLHAAYWDRSIMSLLEHQLSPAFKYAGLISGAGAIMDLNLINQENMLPSMLFHGDADPVVPYGTAAHHYCPTNASGWLMLFGSFSIGQHLEKIGGTYHLSTFEKGSHIHAGEFFHQKQKYVSDFIERILLGERFKQHFLFQGRKD